MTEGDESEHHGSSQPGGSGGCGFFRKLNPTSRWLSPSAAFWKLSSERDELARSVRCPSPRRPPSSWRWRMLSWTELKAGSLEWVWNPYNLALLLWIVCVAISGAILFLVMTGMLDSALPRQSQRDAWFEANNQILNALFTLMCLYQHPRRAHHLALLCRWSPSDVPRLRRTYCKDAAYKPHEWAHLTVVVLLLNLNCFAQYALCALNFGYPRSRRPPLAVAVCLSVAVASPAAAGLYSALSPLGRDYGPVLERRLSFTPRGAAAVPRPTWRGRLLGFRDDISVAYLSLFCTFCLFGWNMERLGFGNMYVHVATFALFCTAPFWVFNLAAVNVADGAVREALGMSGTVLCLFGLLYGGFWRVQMRKRFRLTEEGGGGRPWVGNTAVRDCSGWLCCCWCALAQEVRTADFYNIVEDGFAVAAAPTDTPAEYYEGGGVDTGSADDMVRVAVEATPPPTLGMDG